jgi:DNA-binding response OmpR family regulator
MDGYETTQYIKAACDGNTCPTIIALTASAFKEERPLALVSGCDDLICKPFREAEIFEALAQHLNVKFVYSHVPRQTAARDSTEQVDTTPTSQNTVVLELKKVPLAWLAEFQQAVTEGDMMWIAASIQQIQPQHPVLAESLTSLAEKFSYQQLLKLVQLAQ